MDELIQKAKEGKRSAINTLYNDNKNKVFSLALCLLDIEGKAEQITKTVFSKIWVDTAFKKIETEDEFESLCFNYTINECKKAILKDNPKAFLPPKNQNFIANASSEYSSDFWKDATKNFTMLQKFIFVTRVITKATPSQIAKHTNIDEGTIKLAINAEEYYFKNKNVSAVESNLLQYAKSQNFTSNDLTGILNAINAYVEPFEKQALMSKIRVLTVVLITSIIVAVILLLVSVITGNNSNTSSSETQSSEIEPQWKNSVTATDYAVIDIKDHGVIKVALDGKTAPITVENFKKLAKKGFYNGLTFHRIMENFMMQGGCPKGDGTGDADENIKGEFYANGVANDIGHFRGAISMARSTPMDSASCQFFIVHKDSPHLNGQYATFGFVVEGMDVVDKICTEAEPTDNNGTISSSDQPIINSIKIYTVEEYEKEFGNSSKETSENSSKELTSETHPSETPNDNSDSSSELSSEISEIPSKEDLSK